LAKGIAATANHHRGPILAGNATSKSAPGYFTKKQTMPPSVATVQLFMLKAK